MFTAIAGRLSIAGTDLATLGAELARTQGLLGGYSATVPAEALASSRLVGQVATGPRLVNPREVTLILNVAGTSPANLFANLRAIANLCASHSTAGAVTVQLPVFDTTRSFSGVLTRTTESIPDPQALARVAELTLTFSVLSGTLIGPTANRTFGGGLETFPSGDAIPGAPTPVLVNLFGPVVAPGIQLVSSAGTEIARLAFGGLTLGTGDTLEVTTDGQMRKTIGGVVSSAVGERTAGRPIVLRQEYWAGGLAPRVRLLSNSSPAATGSGTMWYNPLYV